MGMEESLVYGWYVRDIIRRSSYTRVTLNKYIKCPRSASLKECLGHVPIEIMVYPKGYKDLALWKAGPFRRGLPSLAKT
jgi:hypothetical protein